MTLPPGPDYHPVQFILRWGRDPLRVLDECAARFGETFTLRPLAFPPMVIVTNPEHVRDVFAGNGDDQHAGEANRVLRPFLGDHSLILLDGPEHLRQRKLLLPPFHGERMQAYGAEMLAIANAAVDRWPVGAPFAVQPEMQDITLQVILRTVFGLAEGAKLTQLYAIMRRGLETATSPWLLFPWLQVDLGRHSPWGRFKHFTRLADEVLFTEIRQRREAGTRGRTDVLSLLLDARDEAGHPMTDQELRDELVTLLVAGHETTATALSWSLRWVLGRPLVREKLEAEVTRAGALTPERVARMEYLDAVVRETLRLQPVIPMVGRVLQKPARVAGCDLPAGVVVAPSVYLAQRRAAAFPRPDEFVPERFLGAKIPGYEWFPFGGGLRRCIGMAFALYEMKMVLATLVARADLRLASPYPGRHVRRSITLSPRAGLPVVLRARRPAVASRDEASRTHAPASV